MNYAASVGDFFKSPKWMSNLLLGGLCILIPILGPMVVFGWLVTGFWSRTDEDFATFPAFEFAQFDKYLERGLWPFLVTLATGFIIVPFIWLLMFGMMAMSVFSFGDEQRAGGCLGAIVMLCLILVAGAGFLSVIVLLVPLKLRATMTQDFAKAFDFRFVKRFLALVWAETMLSVMFTVLVSALLISFGALFLCVGAYLSTVVSYFAGTHLHKQLYALYLSRGGEPVPLSLNLIVVPPALPTT
ncbi:MAG: DUF4013 domain-containing protein [Chthoniobacterales bacterium]